MPEPLGYRLTRVACRAPAPNIIRLRLLQTCQDNIFIGHALSRLGCSAVTWTSLRSHSSSRILRNAKADPDADSTSATASVSSSLPSQNEKQRWQIAKRWSAVMDNVLARASVAGQHINVYTGTDYTGIEALRKEILAQEEQVRTQHLAVAVAKDAHAQARKKQTASQKEVVGLLERKASWSQADLERYMALVRSEHIDDQAVQRAAEELAASERQLEASRALVEKLERQQYHEEQIWSDTIRRNSTWVTMCLMGINIVLLLAQISIFEPYRRRKIVDQIEQALDHRAPVPSVLSHSVVAVESAPLQPPAEQGASILTEKSISESSATSAYGTEEEIALVKLPPASEQSPWDRTKSAVQDLFSEQTVQMRQSDRTALVLESALFGVGIALVGSLAMLKSS